MKTLDRLSENLSRRATWRTILPSLLLLAAVLFFMETGPSGKAALAKASGGQGMLNMEFGYGAGTLYSLFDSRGPAGLGLYSRLLCLDFAFAAAFMLFQSLTLSSLLRRAGAPSRLRRLNLLPFARSALDAAENLLLLALMGLFPERFPLLAAAASLATMLKWILHYVIVGLLLLTGFLSGWRKKQEQKRRGRTSAADKSARPRRRLAA